MKKCVVCGCTISNERAVCKFCCDWYASMVLEDREGVRKIVSRKRTAGWYESLGFAPIITKLERIRRMTV